MATAFYTVRVENQYGEFIEFEYDYDFDSAEWDDEPFDPEDSLVQKEIYDSVMDNIYVDVCFSHLED